MDARALRTSLLNACNDNDGKAAAKLLIKHAKLMSPDLRLQNLGAVAKQLEHGSEVVKTLEENLYSAGSKKWQGTGLHQLISQGLQFKQENNDTQQLGLAPLYPN